MHMLGAMIISASLLSDEKRTENDPEVTDDL